LTTLKAYDNGWPLLKSFKLGGPATPKSTWGGRPFSFDWMVEEYSKKNCLKMIELTKS
jgi:hypothetical protein